MHERPDASARLAAATRLLATLRAGRARVERLAEQHLLFDQLVRLHGLGIADDPVDDLRRTQEMVDRQLQAWRQARSAVVRASIGDAVARELEAPRPAPSRAEPPPREDVTNRDEPPPPDEPTPLLGLGPPLSVGVAGLAVAALAEDDQPAGGDDDRESGIVLVDTPPLAEEILYETDAPLPAEAAFDQDQVTLADTEEDLYIPEPPRVNAPAAPPASQEGPGYLIFDEVAARPDDPGETEAQHRPAADSFVAFDDDNAAEDAQEEDEYDPWAARRAATAEDDGGALPTAAQGQAEETPGDDDDEDEGPAVAAVRLVPAVADPSALLDEPSAALEAGGSGLVHDERADLEEHTEHDRPVVEDELDTLNAFSLTAGELGEDEDASDEGTGGAVARLSMSAPRVISPRFAADEDDEDVPTRAAGSRIVLGAGPEPETGSVRPVSPGLPESLTNELDAAPAADEFLLDEEGGGGGFSVSFEHARKPGPAEEESAEVRHEHKGPRLTDDEPSGAVSNMDDSLEIAPLADVDTVRLDEFLKSAHEAEAKGDLHEAITRYGDAMDLAPEQLDAYLGRGRAHMELGDYAAAMSDFQRAEDLAPGAPAPLAEMGNLYFARKEYRRAIDFYDQALDIDPSMAMARCRRGICHHYRRNHKQAFQDLQKASSLDPDIPNIRKYVQMAVKAMERDRPTRK